MSGRCTYRVASTNLKRGHYFVRIRATAGGSDYTLSGHLSNGIGKGLDEDIAEALWWRSTVAETACCAGTTSPVALDRAIPVPPTRNVEGRLELVSEGDERGAVVMIRGAPSLDGVVASMRGHIVGIGSVVSATFCDEGKCRATLEPGVELSLLPQYNLVSFEAPSQAIPKSR